MDGREAPEIVEAATRQPSQTSEWNLAFDPSRRCTATANRTGGRCQQVAIRGGTVCATHGGRSPQVKAKAAARLAADKAARDVARLGGRLDIDPAAALEVVVQGAAADVAALELLVAELTPEQLARSEGTSLTGMLRDARAELRRAAKAALDAGVDERRVRISEATTTRVIQAVVLGLQDLGELLPAEVLPAARVAIGRRMRDLSPSQ